MLQLLLNVLLIAATSTMYRCAVPGEPVMFSDLPCPGGARVSVKTGNTVSMAPLTEGEQRRLDALQKAAEKRTSQRRQALRRQRARLAEDTRRAEAACRSARNQLEALKLRKRKGYTLVEGVRIAQLATTLRETVRANC